MSSEESLEQKLSALLSALHRNGDPDNWAGKPEQVPLETLIRHGAGDDGDEGVSAVQVVEKDAEWEQVSSELTELIESFGMHAGAPCDRGPSSVNEIGTSSAAAAAAAVAPVMEMRHCEKVDAVPGSTSHRGADTLEDLMREYVQNVRGVHLCESKEVGLGDQQRSAAVVVGGGESSSTPASPPLEESDVPRGGGVVLENREDANQLSMQELLSALDALPEIHL